MNDQESPLDQLRNTAAMLFELAPHTPSRIRLRSGDASIEVHWPQAGPAPATAPATAPAPAPPLVTEEAADDTLVAVRAPLLGTFYRSPAPEAPPFVTPGDKVEKGQQIGIVESMKLMNPVESAVAGTVVEVLVADAAPVEFDQVLLTVTTAGAGDGCAEVFPGGRS
ncbi:acetyl-CoA carboxylase biotin carboxyl carrier protein [Actinoplanes sp. NPDC023936]|uniref:acetyl-CoA carboxylase biotin carboxyl carrier protein n=1 Tax=Actinoplanes sp. NPDC023936 TaxID=3154910 RepID=UPI0033FF787F